ncbi:MAG: 50S ribosomal protein L21 [Clostridia bacterium]|nr:50S ribosomal protein L21 [Clostridia bacterium]MDD4048074.1 50S ribosomal protein L21 [Clostridia bacterium]
MYAVIETGGKQYKVQEGDILNIEKLNIQEGETAEVTEVLAIVDEEKVSIGKPFLEGAKVVLKVLEHGKDKKVLIFKYKPKKKYRKMRGHRQPFTKVSVETIAVNG